MAGTGQVGKRAWAMAERSLERLGHNARRRMCPLYVAGPGPGDRKSVPPHLSPFSKRRRDVGSTASFLLPMLGVIRGHGSWRAPFSEAGRPRPQGGNADRRSARFQPTHRGVSGGEYRAAS